MQFLQRIAMSDHTNSISALGAQLHALIGLAPADGLRRLIDAGADRLPLPGHGATLARWRALAAVGAHDLSLAKLFEGHTDALAILHEAGVARGDASSVWGTWCAEPPDARLRLAPTSDGFALSGRKAWCSGARAATHAVVSCWSTQNEAMLAAVDLRRPGVRMNDEGWQAVGMRDSGSIDVHFDGVPAQVLGGPGFYVQRAGFWHGGAGVAAVWFGAATALAEALRVRLAAQGDPHRLAQLGQVGIALQGSAALMREAASAIDHAPQANAMGPTLAVRLSVEASATATLAAVGRALGPGPMCKDGAMARRFADLPVFMRQSHAERDLEALGRLLAAEEGAAWTL
jgi:hypothetical protein